MGCIVIINGNHCKKPPKLFVNLEFFMSPRVSIVKKESRVRHSSFVLKYALGDYFRPYHDFNLYTTSLSSTRHFKCCLYIFHKVTIEESVLDIQLAKRQLNNGTKVKNSWAEIILATSKK